MLILQCMRVDALSRRVGSPAFDEYQFQSIVLTALQAISRAVFSVRILRSIRRSVCLTRLGTPGLSEKTWGVVAAHATQLYSAV